jgi:hypothetical protein
MKQLELQVNIRQTKDDLWEITAYPMGCNERKLTTYCFGCTYQKAIYRFYNIIANTIARYWFMLKEGEGK